MVEIEKIIGFGLIVMVFLLISVIADNIKKGE